jgi:hypothetical protein
VRSRVVKQALMSHFFRALLAVYITLSIANMVRVAALKESNYHRPTPAPKHKPLFYGAGRLDTEREFTYGDWLDSFQPLVAHPSFADQRFGRILSTSRSALFLRAAAVRIRWRSSHAVRSSLHRLLDVGFPTVDQSTNDQAADPAEHKNRNILVRDDSVRKADE